jgi:hypothetical protein
MKRQKSCGPRLGKLVHQLPGVVTFAYDLRFRRMIAHWKDISEEYNICEKNSMMKFWSRNIPQKMSFRASKRLQKLGPKKLLKIVNCQNGQKTVLSHLEKVGGHRYPPGSKLYHCVVLDDIVCSVT